MFGNHIIRQLSAYHHQEVSASEKLKIETHLQTCSRCRAAYDEIRLGALLASTLKVSPAPESVWNELSTAQLPPRRRRWIPLTAALAALAVTVLFIAIHMAERPSWQVTGLPGTSQLHPGETLQTGTASEAQIKIANIGNLLVSPNSTIRLLVTKSDQHRIALDRGRIEADNLVAAPLVYRGHAYGVGYRSRVQIHAAGAGRRQQSSACHAGPCRPAA